MMKFIKTLLPTVLSALALIVAFMALQPMDASGRPRLGVTNFDSVHLRDTNGTATPNFMADQRGSGAIAEFRDGATPVARIPNGGGLQILSGGLDVQAGILSIDGGFGCTPQAETITATFVLTPTSCLMSLTSSLAVTSSTTTGIITSTATSGDVLILINNNAADAVTIDGTGGTVECKADIVLGAGDTLGLLYNASDLVWNCLFNYDNS